MLENGKNLVKYRRILTLMNLSKVSDGGSVEKSAASLVHSPELGLGDMITSKIPMMNSEH